MNFQQIKQIESNLFDIVYELHVNLKNKNKQQYKLCLAALEELNKDYFEITKKYYIDPDRVISYYEKLWSEF